MEKKSNIFLKSLKIILKKKKKTLKVQLVKSTEKQSEVKM